MYKNIMGFFSDVFGGGKRTPAIAIYGDNVRQLPGSVFPREVKLKIDGEVRTLKETALRDHLVSLCQNGITLTLLEERLKKDGLVEDQMDRRKEIIGLLEKTVKEKK
jgi:hypothetical protein